MAFTRDYALPETSYAKLDRLVDRISAAPGDMIDLPAFRAMQENLNVEEAVRRLPEGLSEDDFVGILKLALLTECATETYGAAFAERANTYEAGWLARFNEDVWVPDELTHHTPYKYILMNMGFDESELDREIRRTQEVEFTHRGGDTPVHVTTFGAVQEYLTDNWHGLIAGLLRSASPQAAYMATRIKRRETLHTVWYRDMTALQVEENPRLVEHVREAVMAFSMPGNQLVPDLQTQVSRWMPLMGADYERIARDLARHIYEVLGDTRRVGAMLMQMAAEKGFSVGPVSPQIIRTALDRLGGPGYGLLGEALLERVGLEYMFRPRGGAQDRAYALYHDRYERIRSMIRSWIAERIEFHLGA